MVTSPYDGTALIAAAQVADAIRNSGGSAFLVGGDVTDYDVCGEIVEDTADHFGKIDGLINNTGGMLRRIPIVQSDEEHDRGVVDLNAHLRTPTEVVRARSSTALPRASSPRSPRASPKNSSVMAFASTPSHRE